MQKKLRLKKWVIVTLLFISIIGLIYSIINIYIWHKSINENETIQHEIINSAIKVIPDEHSRVDEVVIDFDTLKQQNSDTVGYLKVNNTDINYVVVKGEDNKYYLNHNFNKKYNTAGWVFNDYRNNLDGFDKNIIIYGHNMKNGSMFGTLRSVLTSSWQKNEDNLIIEYKLANEDLKFQVFSTYSINVEDYYIKTDFASDDEYKDFIKTIASRSNYKYNIDLDNVSSILTLSTCTGNGTKRVVLHAKKITS